MSSAADTKTLKIFLSGTHVHERINSALDNLAELGRNVAAHSEALFVANSAGALLAADFVGGQCKMWEAATAPFIQAQRVATEQLLAAADWFNVAKREINFAMLEKHAAIVNSFHRISDYPSRIRYANRLVNFVEAAKKSPQFATKLIQTLSLRATTLSRKTFIQNHLMHVAEFRALLSLEGREFSKAWVQLMDIIKKVINYLWKCFIKGAILPRERWTPIPAEAENKCRKEQLWPLLLAFKNH